MNRIFKKIAVALLVGGIISAAVEAGAGMDKNKDVAEGDGKINIIDEIACQLLQHMARRHTGKPEGPVYKEEVSDVDIMVWGGIRRDVGGQLGYLPNADVQYIPVRSIHGVDQINNLEGIQYFSGMKHLQIVNAPELRDASILSSLRNLETLVIYIAPKIECFDFLGELPRLKGLCLFGCNVNLDDFPVLEGLEEITLVACNIEDLAGVNELFPNLVALGVVGMDDLRALPEDMANRISDVSPLVEFNAIGLDLRRNRIRDISPLLEKDYIESIRLDDNPCGEMIVKQAREGKNPLEAFAKARYVGLGNVGLTDAAPLEVLTACRLLYINDNPIEDISFAVKLPNLMRLDVQNSDIKDISPLAEMPQLRYLDISNCNIDDLSPLGKRDLRNMMGIRAANNAIKDISPLAGIHPVERIDLRGNQIEDISPIVEGADGRGWGMGCRIFLQDNPLSEETLINILLLEEKGVDVRL